MRKETDQFIQALSEACQQDFYYVERMLEKMIENKVEDLLNERLCIIEKQIRQLSEMK